MNDRKLNQLFSAAQRETAPPPPAGFVNDVMSAVRADLARSPGGESWLDVFEAWFPRLAWGSALFILLCAGVEAGAGAFGLPKVNEGVSQISQEWLFTFVGG